MGRGTLHGIEAGARSAAQKRRWLFFVGPAKTGTSWVDRALRSTDGVCMPHDVKETHFFDRYFDKGVEWYSDQFVSEPSDLMVEVVPAYFFRNGVAERIRETIPEAQIVVSLRNPVRRAVSHYLHLRKYGFTKLDIGDALDRFPNIAGYSLYAEQLEHWYRVFGKSRVQVVFYEEIVGNVRKLSDEVLIRAGVEPPREVAVKTSPGRVNAAAVPRSRTLARLGQWGGQILREAGLHSVIKQGKRRGLKKLLFAGGTLPDQNDLESGLSAWQRDFAADQKALARLIGRTPPWRSMNGAAAQD
jgi:sulfotransferase family protein